MTDFTVVTGRNGVGKSNILRAMCLFFNGVIEEGVPLDMSRDTSGSARRRRIRVEVEFDLPMSFNFRAGIKDAAERLGWRGGERFWLAREWETDPSTQTTVDRLEQRQSAESDWVPFEASDRRYVDLLLSRLVRFRYVPNHIHPMDLIRSEQDSLQRELIAKINRSRKLGEEFDTGAPLAAMGEIAATMLDPVVKRLQSAAPELDAASLSTPASWAEIAMTLEVEVGSAGQPKRSARLHGSGHQSLLAYSLLYLLDSSFSTKFGWHQATIWAIEEPESFLHQELTYRVADILAQFAEHERFQVLATTHSPTVMAYARSGLIVTHDGVAIASGHQLIDRSAAVGASAYVHPLLAGAPKPLLVVEGETDRDLIAGAYAASGRTNPWEIRPVEDFGVAGGDSGMAQLLKYHASPIASRPRASPVVLLLDHDRHGSKVAALNEAIRAIHETSSAIAFDPDYANPDLDRSCFTGIEAFLSTEAIEAAAQAGAVVLLRPDEGLPIGFNVRNGVDKRKVVGICAGRRTASDYALILDVMEDAESSIRSDT